jgi:Uma2 family endonuclease
MTLLRDVGKGEARAMAVVDRRRTDVPDRLITALLRAGVTSEVVKRTYGATAQEIATLGDRPPERLLPEDMTLVPEDGFLYELRRGELVRMSPSKRRHTRTAGRLAVKLGAYLDVHPVGELHVAEPGYRVGKDDSLLCPDLAFVTAEHEAQRSLDDFDASAPDLAVEVKSPSNTGPKLAEKVAAYLAAGARLVWVLDPEKIAVSVHRSDGTTQTLTSADLLIGEDLLPGFAVQVSELFPPRKSQ